MNFSMTGQVKGDLLIQWLLNRGSIHMNLSMTGQLKGDLLIQVAT